LAAKEAAKKANKSTANVNTLTPEEQIISAEFGKNQGRLPWPTTTGVITSSFGNHPHPTIDGVTINNNGVDISTKKGANALCIFDGAIRQVIDIPGANKAIIIRHGNYLTVYQNLESVFVKKGDTVKKGQKLGKIYTNSAENTTTIHFEIWNESTKQNPALWLAK
jgi:septal ring factor EnvC (AmiA/AmiB activator)